MLSSILLRSARCLSLRPRQSRMSPPSFWRQAIDEELGLFRTEGPTAEELEGARNTIETSIIRGLETLGGFGGVADRLNLYNHFLGDPGYLSSDLRRYRETSTADLRSVAQKRLTGQSRVVVYGVPGQKIIEDVPRAERTAGGGRGYPRAGFVDGAGVADVAARGGFRVSPHAARSGGLHAAERPQYLPGRTAQPPDRIGEHHHPERKRQESFAPARIGFIYRRDAGRGNAEAIRNGNRPGCRAARGKTVDWLLSRLLVRVGARP